LNKYGLVSKDCHTDDVLSLSVEDILERRLQTFVYKHGLAKTIMQARQLVTHGHIAVKNKIIDSPSYLVKLDEEDHINYAINSPFAQDSSKLFGEGKPAPKEA
jgi:small subunit ribosomal protein S4